MAGRDLTTVVDLYHDDLVLHYGGSHSLTGDHVGKDAALTALLTVQARTDRVPIAVLDVMASADHATAWVRERWTVDGEERELHARARVPRAPTASSPNAGSTTPTASSWTARST